MRRTPRERGLHELYSDPERADAIVFGRPVGSFSRRRLLLGGGTLAALVGAGIPYEWLAPEGWVPIALADSKKPFRIPGKDSGLVVLNDRPVNAETPAHLLDDDVTPAARMFVRNNGVPPTSVDARSWKLEIRGESTERQATFSIADLKKKFTAHTYRLQLECGGNGRSEFRPRAKGNQWTTGAIQCAEWTGARLSDVLDDVGVKQNAVYVGYYGADQHLSGDGTKVVISRGVPIAKAREKETLLAWAVNGSDIPPLHGAPLRLVAGGWPGSVSGKWVKRLVVRDKVHDGPKMTGFSYRVPCRPIARGEKVLEKDMCIIESMPVKSLVTFPRSGIVHPKGKALSLRGHAWAGDQRVKSVSVSIDFGQTWKPCKLDAPKNRLAWQRWSATVEFPRIGYYEVWARATDAAGRSQPMLVPGWNPKGYLNNACHRIAVRVA